jgi:hypothetical protein
MTDMLRYKWTSFGPMLDEDGPFVTYADHVEALRQASLEPLPSLAYEQGQRDVFAYHPEWTVTGMCKPDCLPCQRLTELITEREKGYEEGQRDALKAAVQRVEALIDPWPNTSPGLIRRGNVFAAIKGDSDD